MTRQAQSRQGAMFIFAACLAFSPSAFGQSVLGGNSNGSAPANSVGAEGQWFEDASTGLFYGPKTSGAWPATPLNPAPRGTTSGTAACTGCIGEEIESSIAVGSAVPATTATPIDITTITITPGNWMCNGNVATSPAGGTTTSLLAGTINTVANTLATMPNDGNGFWNDAAVAAGVVEFNPLGARIYRVSTSTILHLVGQANFAVSTLGLYGYLGCVRIY